MDPSAAAPLIDDGLLARSDGRLILTERGMLLANDVVLALT